MRPIDADALKGDCVVTSTTTNSLCNLYVSMEQIAMAPTVKLASPWHRVEDGLPKQGEWVLVKSCLVQMSTDFIDKTWRWYRTPGVTHWMPLPEPPMEDA
jgi:hypothetical protein